MKPTNKEQNSFLLLLLGVLALLLTSCASSPRSTIGKVNGIINENQRTRLAIKTMGERIVNDPEIMGVAANPLPIASMTQVAPPAYAAPCATTGQAPSQVPSPIVTKTSVSEDRDFIWIEYPPGGTSKRYGAMELRSGIVGVSLIPGLKAFITHKDGRVSEGRVETLDDIQFAEDIKDVYFHSEPNTVAFTLRIKKS